MLEVKGQGHTLVQVCVGKGVHFYAGCRSLSSSCWMNLHLDVGKSMLDQQEQKGHLRLNVLFSGFWHHFPESRDQEQYKVQL